VTGFEPPGRRWGSKGQELEEKGVVSRHVIATSPPSVEYALTDLGDELVPAIRSIAAIGHKRKQREAPTRCAA